MISCDQAAKLLSDYLDKTLDSDMYAAVKGHLSSCPACKKVFENVSFLNARLKASQKLSVSSDFDQKLRSRIQSSQTDERPKVNMRSISYGFSGAAVCAALTFFAVSDFSSSPSKADQIQNPPEVISSQPAVNPAAIQQASAAPVTSDKLAVKKDSLKKETIPVDQSKIKLAGQENE